MPPNHFKSLSLPDSTYEGIQRARVELQQRGIGAIPPHLLNPPQCPSCGGAVEHVTIGVQHIKCGGCGYAQQTVSVEGNAFAPFATGVLVGAAVAALLIALNSGDKPKALPPKKRAITRAAPKRLASKRR
jgi:hypothetical protein